MPIFFTIKLLYSTGYNFFGFISAGIVFHAFSGYLCMAGLKNGHKYAKD